TTIGPAKFPNVAGAGPTKIMDGSGASPDCRNSATRPYTANHTTVALAAWRAGTTAASFHSVRGACPLSARWATRAMSALAAGTVWSAIMTGQRALRPAVNIQTMNAAAWKITAVTSTAGTSAGGASATLPPSATSTARATAPPMGAPAHPQRATARAI